MDLFASSWLEVHAGIMSEGGWREWERSFFSMLRKGQEVLYLVFTPLQQRQAFQKLFAGGQQVWRGEGVFVFDTFFRRLAEEIFYACQQDRKLISWLGEYVLLEWILRQQGGVGEDFSFSGWVRKILKLVGEVKVNYLGGEESPLGRFCRRIGRGAQKKLIYHVLKEFDNILQERGLADGEDALFFLAQKMAEEEVLERVLRGKAFLILEGVDDLSLLDQLLLRRIIPRMKRTLGGMLGGGESGFDL
ncbi:MAG: hypothetical protein D6805_04375, partial [Planctomycetota bacterium]